MGIINGYTGMFYLIWLKDIIPAIINNKIFQSIIDNGLPTSPVFVLDISIVLPALIISAILLLKKKVFGYFITSKSSCYFIIISYKQVKSILDQYIDYYNTMRPHQGINQQIPKNNEPKTEGKIIKMPILSGLHHHYYRKTA